jgi:hypothetical protein
MHSCSLIPRPSDAVDVMDPPIHLPAHAQFSDPQHKGFSFRTAAAQAFGINLDEQGFIAAGTPISTTEHSEQHAAAHINRTTCNCLHSKTVKRSILSCRTLQDASHSLQRRLHLLAPSLQKIQPARE